MEDALIVLLQALAEVLFQILGSGLLDWLFWPLDSDRRPVSRGCAMIPAMFCLGGLLGRLTVWLVPHAMLPWGWLRIANLIAGPLLSAWVAWRIARWRRANGHHTDPRFHAFLAGSACLGMVVVRFVVCAR